MCNNCYHSTGRDKKAWKCAHTTKGHYALGLCQNCYQSRYMLKTKIKINNSKSKNSSYYEENENHNDLYSQNSNSDSS
jgi:hypothetical protein